ncbi:MAG TPA: PqqD family protein [Thermoanaerobaculia bacterium]|nr:PqqD family protein [Thermoanaerobaculia bacterium]
MQSTTVFAHSGEFVLRNVGSEAVLVPIRNRVGDLDSVYTMSEVAVRIWSLIDGVRDSDAIAARISAEYDVEPNAAAQDVKEILLALEEADLIRRA